MAKPKNKVKEYPIEDEPLSMVSEDAAVYGVMDVLRRGISFSAFLQIVKDSLLDMHEWAQILHLDTRTLQRYKTSNLTFAPLQSEKILEIKLLNDLGARVFGDVDSFDTWLRTKSVSLGGTPPKDLLDNSFGITLVKDELLRIQYGVLA